MSSPTSCIRCSKPLVIVSPSGLCQRCAATEVTPGPTSPVVPVVDMSAPTRTAHYDATTSADPDSRPTPLPPAPAGYDLLQRLGAGGMGAVYLAREQAAERLVAMKFIHAPGSQSSLDRFLVELRVLAKLEHDNIVRVFGSDFLRADPFFTMEYLPGGSLADVVKSSGRMLPAEAVRLIRPVAEAVRAAHEQGVIHRDLKPSNILLAADGTPKVSDFSLAKRLDRDDGVTVGTGGLGTPGYMPPEQISRKNGEPGPWSDVYGLGATLYHLLTARPPFVGDTPEEIVPRVLADPLTRPRALRPDIPMELEGIVVKCLEKDPKDRYQSVGELAADLDRFRVGQKPVAPPLTPWRRVKRWARRNRRAVTVSALAVLLLVGVVSLGAAFWPKKPVPPEPPDEMAAMRKELEAMRAELADARKVTVVPNAGLPRWREWRVAGTGPTANPGLNGGSYIEAIDYGLLDLLPAPGVNRYRVTVELRYRAAIEPAAAPGAKVAPPAMGFAGLYLADERQTGADGTVLQPLLLTRFTDTTAVGKPPKIRAASLDNNLMSQKPDQDNRVGQQGIAEYKFLPSQDVPGPWRKLRLTIIPEEIRAEWGNPDGTFTPFKPLESGFSVPGRQAELQQRMNAVAPGGVAPAWNPAGLTVGVLCHRCRVDFRNLTVEPIP